MATLELSRAQFEASGNLISLTQQDKVVVLVTAANATAAVTEIDSLNTARRPTSPPQMLTESSSSVPGLR